MTCCRSALACPLSSCGGLVVSRDSLDVRSDWACHTCHHTVTADHVTNTGQAARQLMSGLDTSDSGQLEELLYRLGRLLHHTHHLLVQAEYIQYSTVHLLVQAEYSTVQYSTVQYTFSSRQSSSCWSAWSPHTGWPGLPGTGESSCVTTSSGHWRSHTLNLLNSYLIYLILLNLIQF